jgi:hypothetical protein
MAAKDIYHAACVRALEKDGWTITHDPLTVGVGKTDLLIDLGAERMVAAEREGERIAVEVKSFVKLSAVQDLKEAVGQYILYAGALEESPENAGRVLYLAIRDETYEAVFEEPIGQMLLRHAHLPLIIFNADREEIIQWRK